jgi:hypothetical protein
MGRTIPSFRIARALEKADFVSLWKLRLKKKKGGGMERTSVAFKIFYCTITLPVIQGWNSQI